MGEVFARCDVVFCTPGNSIELERQTMVMSRLTRIFNQIFIHWEDNHWICETNRSFDIDRICSDLSRLIEQYPDTIDSISCRMYGLSEPTKEFKWSRGTEINDGEE